MCNTFVVDHGRAGICELVTVVENSIPMTLVRAGAVGLPSLAQLMSGLEVLLSFKCECSVGTPHPAQW